MMKLTRKAVALAGAAAMMASCNHMKQIKHMPYPETQRTDVVDDYFGTKVADPYRWLEDDNSEATAAWVKAQNAVTQDYLSQIPFRDAIRGRLTQLWNYPKEGIPAKHGDAWYYFYNDGGAFVGGFFQGREILRLRGGRIRLGLGGDSCDEHRRPHVHDR